MQKRKHICFDINIGSYRQFIHAIYDLAAARTSSYVCVANVHMLVEAYRDKQFKHTLDQADLVTPDGMPLAKSFHLLYGIRQERVAGMDLVPDLLAHCQGTDAVVYFYGGTAEMLEKTQQQVAKQFPGLKVGGVYSPPFRALTEEEEKDVVQQIQDSGANLVFVSLGCPKQEKWMQSMKGRIPAVMVGVGGALMVYAGLQKRAPVWMQKSCLEWLFRLGQEPRRLFKRYFITNNMFLYLLIKTKAKLVLHGEWVAY